jgi:hypothetical protein
MVSVALLGSLLPAASGLVLAADPHRVLIFNTFIAPDTTWTKAAVAPTNTVGATGSTSQVEVSSTDANNSTFSAAFTAPTGADLVAGTYPVSQNAPTPSEGVLFLIQESQACYGLGAFEILEAPTVDGAAQVQTFAARFDVTCGNRRVVGVAMIEPTVPVQALVLDPQDTYDFGLENVGVKSDPVPLHLHNVGTAPITVTGATLADLQYLADTDSFLVDDPCTVIDPGSTCDLSMRYRGAMLEVSTTAFAMPSRIRLTGQGQFVAISNNTPATAVVIDSLPFIHGGDPPPEQSSACGYTGKSMWYRYQTDTKRRISFTNMYGTNPPELFQGSISSMTHVQCAPGSELQFTALPGVTYWIHVVLTYPQTDRGLVKVTEGPLDDAVAVRSITRSPATFYPYVDGYVDTVSIKGIRAEPVRVVVRVYSPTNKPLRALSAPMATGAFDVKWNGKSSSGVLQPAGKYKLVATANDEWGNVAVYTYYVNLSRKRLYNYTYTKTLDAGAYIAHGTAGSGRLSRAGSRYTGGLKISSGSAGAASVAYNFTVPAATVYKSVRFEALGVSQIPGIFVGVQDWAACTGYSIGCVDPWARGPILYAWHGVKGGKKNVSTGRRVRGYLYAEPYASSNTWMDARDVRVVVSYGILR